MKEAINYLSPEGQEFQAKPHVSLMKSEDSPRKWRIDLRWREDSSNVRIDAEFNFVDGYSPLFWALREAIWFGEYLNLPVVKYEDTSMVFLKKPESQPSKKQKVQLQRYINSDITQRFPTH